jgi:hypothetical protein
MDLSDDEIRRFADLCADSSHPTARKIMLTAGANSASGVLAKVLLSSGPDRQRLIELIREAVSSRC